MTLKGTEEPKQGQVNLSIVSPRNLRSLPYEEKEPDNKELFEEIQARIDEAVANVQAQITNEFNEYIDQSIHNTINNYFQGRTYKAGNGITISGLTISVNIDTDQFQFSSKQLQTKLDEC